MVLHQHMNFFNNMSYFTGISLTAVHFFFLDTFTGYELVAFVAKSAVIICNVNTFLTSNVIILKFITVTIETAKID